MVRENRIKEYRFQETFNATTSNTFYTDHVINGEILSINYKFNRAGSMALQISGTGEEFWRDNAISGANWGVSYPVHFGESTTGSITAASQFPFVVRDPIGLVVGSGVSGTQALDIVVRYR